MRDLTKTEQMIEAPNKTRYLGTMRKTPHKELAEEINRLIERYELKCDVENFEFHANWFLISKSKGFSYDFIEFFEDKINWRLLSIEYNLSHDFVERFQNKLMWHLISDRELSESFIEKYSNRVDWQIISERQNLSYDFLKRNSEKINSVNLLMNKKIDPYIIYDFVKSMGAEYMTVIQNQLNKYVSNIYDELCDGD